MISFALTSKSNLLAFWTAPLGSVKTRSGETIPFLVYVPDGDRGHVVLSDACRFAAQEFDLLLIPGVFFETLSSQFTQKLKQDC